MNPNADYLGVLNLLRSLREQALISEAETKRSPHGSWSSSAQTSLFLCDSFTFQIAFVSRVWYCVLLTKEVTAE